VKLLIVDDSEQMRRALRSLLGDLAEEMFEACDGASALETCRTCRPDWVLMDVRMAGLDGIRATRLVRSAHPETNVLIMTSFDDPGVREAATAAGACAFVLKDDLLALRRILSAPPGQDAA
jgi:DNA-binding NarL/FixJ family response regulator